MADIGRRKFLKLTGLQAGALAAGAAGPLAPGAGSGSLAPWTAGEAPTAVQDRPDVAVIGAGAFGIWTAYHLRLLGAQVTVVDQHGPGNNRATSMGETRGVRTAYADNELWTRWARRAIERWNDYEERWRDLYGVNLFFSAGDLILRPEMDDFLQDTREVWDRLGHPYEELSLDEVEYRWPQVDLEGISVAFYEPDAGVVRARRVCETVAEMLRRAGGTLRIGHAAPGRTFGDRMVDLRVRPGERIEADAYVFALGPWFPKVFPDLLGDKMTTPIGHVVYYAVPPGDNRFVHPHMPSYNLPGVTGWPALPPDHRGFRVRTGGRPSSDPDASVRYMEPEHLERPREFVEERFPALAGAPVLQTMACHYEMSADRKWFVDTHPEWKNVWLTGGGSAEGFKFGPVMGEYVAKRVLGRDPHPELKEEFRLPQESLGKPAY